MPAKILNLVVIVSIASICDSAESTLGRLKAYLQGETDAYGISVDLSDDKQVNISMLLMSISNLNAAEQIFTFSAGFRMTWLDPNLAWNKTDYDNITEVTISEKFVWIPTIAIPNGIDSATLASEQSPKISTDSGEKMSYLISIFVSYAVFMNFVNDSIPKSGDVCRLSVYLTLILCQSCLAIITTMATLNVRNNGHLFQTKTDVQPEHYNVNPKSTERPSKVRRSDHVLFGVFLLLALMSLLVFCV
ncbi:neuronal acetylcholine receptor subunit alpha-10-like [Haliotis rufescens]|uniref:neuronal acetylcholine receptor subunit alpha-10-like n=1 Tax=Haliotis rufescens TaxID=6454 RepID=UPI00201F2386|nr:neuronal acetylcholine receptor subunit alpha-10-like [Haliotis rufescens]XP_048245790.1 neuronal acetylcholine receptor subunit alpha-10-like [Haliotis rufescens]